MAYIPIPAGGPLAGVMAGQQAQQANFQDPEQIARRRRLAEIMAQRGFGQQPRTGIEAAGNLAQIISSTLLNKRADKAETQNRDLSRSALVEALAAKDPELQAMILSRAGDPTLQEAGINRAFSMQDAAREAAREAALRSEEREFETSQTKEEREFKAEQNRLDREARLAAARAKNPPVDLSSLRGDADGQGDQEQGEARPGITLWEAVPQAVGFGNTLNDIGNRFLPQLVGATGADPESAFDPKTAEARSAFKLVERDLIRAFSINPRFPVAEQNRILNLVPQATALESTPNARANLAEIDKALQRQVQDDIRLISSGALSNKDASELVQRVGLIRSIREQIGIPNEAGSAGGRDAGEAGSIRDGATATNPQTGERIVYRNGRWEPLE